MSHLTDEARAAFRDAQPKIVSGEDSLEAIVAANPGRRSVLKNGLLGLMGGATMPGPVIRALPFGEKLSAAGMDFEILPTPGHSKGSVCLYLPAEGVLFSGDTLFLAGFGRMDLYGGSPMEMRESLKRLFALPPETRVYPGHGGETTIGAERSRYRL